MKADFDPYRTFKYAEVYSAKGDVSKAWYCYWFEQVPECTPVKWKMFKKTAGMNRIHSAGARMKFAKELQRAINKMLDAGKSAFPKSEDSRTLKACIEKYLADHVKNLKSRTYTTAKSNTMALLNYCDPHGKKAISVFDITKDTVMMALTDLQKQRRWSNTTRNNVLTFWRTLFNWLIGRGMILNNPTDKIPFLKEYPTDLTRPATEEEFERIVNCLYQNDKPLFLYFGFIYFQGYRVSETGFLRRDKFEFGTKRPYIRLTALEQKDNEVSYQYISPHLLPYLLEMKIDKLPKDYYLFSRKLLPGPKPLKKVKDLVDTRWKKLIKEGLGIPVNLYSSKHKQATELGDLVDDDSIMKFLRHSDIRTTKGYMKNKRMQVPYSFFSNQRALPLKKSK